MGVMMKVNVTKSGHYAKIEGETKLIEKGEQELPEKVAASMVASGFAIDVKAEAEAKKQAEPKKK